LPIIHEDWKFLSTNLKLQNTTRGDLTNCTLVETDEEKLKDIYGIKITNIPETKFWHVKNSTAVKRVTITLNIQQRDKVW